MTTFIVDASLALKWLIKEPDTDLSIALTLESQTRLAPDYILVECANVISKKVRRKLLAPRAGEEIINSLHLLPIKFQPTNSLIATSYNLSTELHCSVYDCLYLALAVTRDCRLITADKRFYSAVSKSAFGDYIQLLGSE